MPSAAALSRPAGPIQGFCWIHFGEIMGHCAVYNTCFEGSWANSTPSALPFQRIDGPTRSHRQRRLGEALGHQEAAGSIWRRANPMPSAAALSRPAGPIRGFCWIHFGEIVGHCAVYNTCFEGSWANSTPSASPLQRSDGPTRSHRQRRLGEALGHREATGSIWRRANPMPSAAALLGPAGPIRGFC